jgi:hypothetical protein
VPVSEELRLRADDLSWRDVEGDIVILDERTWNYVHLNATASVLWRSLADAASEAQLVEGLTTAFPVSAEDAASDVAAFLEDLRARDYLAS